MGNSAVTIRWNRECELYSEKGLKTMFFRLLKPFSSGLISSCLWVLWEWRRAFLLLLIKSSVFRG